MSILIKDMEMPTGYVELGIALDADGHPTAVTRDGEIFDVIPVPEHGRLIDADALEQDAQKRLLMCNKNDNQFQKPYEVMRAITLAPTVIYASEED